ncbi:MAG: site-specific integrase [Phycisphaerales bacterium]|nr:site-specific integrase [Phycisphaerales bacterium]
MPDGRRVQKYLGQYDSDESKAAYKTAIADWKATLAQHARPQVAAVGAPTVELLVAEYLRHAEQEYRNADGVLSKGFPNLVNAARPLLAVLRNRPTATVTCGDLKHVRTTFADGGDRCRTYVNDTMRRVLAMFRWGVEEGLVPGPVWHALSAFRHVRLGRGGLRETDPVEAVPRGVVDAILPHLPPLLVSAIELLWWSGMRAGELVTMTTRDVERTGEQWLYRPTQHKGTWRGKDRVVYLGPRCIERLRPLLKADPGALLFTAADVMHERKAAWRAARRTPVQPSQQARDERNAAKAPQYADSLDVATLRRAVHRACDAAGVERFGLHRLRHAAGTRLVLEAGDGAARVQLGHSDGRMVRRYSVAADAELGRKVAARHA